MTDLASVAPHPTVKVARDLTEIVTMCAHLDDQAEHKANARLDGTSLPGGEAMVSLAGVAEPEINERRVAIAEEWHATTCERADHARCWTGSEDEDDEGPVLQTLLFWSEQWREEHGYPLEGRRPTVATEANLIRSLLDWAWSNELHFDDFAADVRKARVRVENVLYAGNRAERTRVECNQCDRGPRLIRKYGNEPDGSDDWWLCSACKYRFDAKAVSEAHGKMLRSEGAARFVPQIDAIGTLRAQGRSERTVRKWLAEGEGEAWCDPVTHEVWVWWPALWHKHLVTATRQRMSAS